MIKPTLTASELDIFKNFTALEAPGHGVSLDLKHRKHVVRLWPLRISNKLLNKLRGYDTERLE